MGAAAVGAIQFVHAPVAPRPFAQIVPDVQPSANAFGTSKEVRLRFGLPGAAVAFPLAVFGDPTTLSYEWVARGDTTPVDRARPLTDSTVVAPNRPGYYQLVLLHRPDGSPGRSVKEIVAEPSLAVMVPFGDMENGLLNGYHIGTYLAERLGSGYDRPAGFLQVMPGDVDLSVSRHFRLGDFVTHDRQADVWPKYVALSPRLLDKLELVVAEIERRRGAVPDDSLSLDVHSGFRTPAHNAEVQRAARDSRHQYGDAADVVIDANRDGRITRIDSRLVASAVDSVEQHHPDLVGGLGLYTSGRYRTPYVHIDVRGRRSRWQG
ncbi:MAG TPA: D-Ala-D-Ala carboxypeptidase family metallohydrolase [Gemmatimonadaceae bacterium]|nr:D-Ala-D-Ala carboxypeptidase family metallohydrolase [Gemmatimonadaceae bacterium]